jgi:predicted dehydrogenase
VGRTQRRDFLKASALAGAGFWIANSYGQTNSRSPNEKLNVASVGCGGKGGSDIEHAATENVVALCDVDDHRGAGSFKKFPQAKRYKDFREMLEKEKSLDVVIVSTPDHTHAPAAAMAMRMGKHVYCQKPLTHTVYEARALRDIARQYKVATQMGNQGTASSGFRKGVEVIRAGAIGPVREVHVWTNRPIWEQGVQRPPAEPVPEHVAWDLWLGPAPQQPYSSKYVPFSWRGYWDFGTGAIGDMACHTANLAFMSLELGAPLTVEAVTDGTATDVSPPKKSIITFEFPARGDMPPVKLVWYEGGNRPPAELAHGRKLSSSGLLLVGDEGVFFSPNDYGAEHFLLPEEKFKDYKQPPDTLPRLADDGDRGHMQEFLAACKGGPPAMSNFDYAATMTETMLLGNVAMRVGKKIEWDAQAMQAKNCPEAAQYIRIEPRKGWELV